MGSRRRLEDVRARLQHLRELRDRLQMERPPQVASTALAVAQDLGSSLHDPFMALSFLALEVIPALKLTDQGLVDVEKFDFVPLWVE